MSVCGFVLNTTNSNEENFTFPIATEKIYTNYWFKFAEDNDLYWLKCFMWGVDVTKSDFPAIIDELQQFRAFMENTSDLKYLEKKVYILDRIQLFIEKLNEVVLFSDDVILFIG